MGLDTSHDCWHGPYSSFMRWRRAVARCIGIDIDQMEGFCACAPMSWEGVIDPLKHLLCHSDCDGELDWQICGELADRLEAIAPLMPADDKHGDWMRDATLRFAAGCRQAYEAQENVEFR